MLQISCRNGAGWVFPKGGWELDETAESAARRETVEESGVRGQLEGGLVGSYGSMSRKEAGKGCTSFMFALHVEEELTDWPEAGQRQRAWVRLPLLSLMIERCVCSGPPRPACTARMDHCAS